MSVRLVDRDGLAIAYVRPGYVEAVRLSPALLAGAELAVGALNDVHYANPVADERISLARETLLAVIGLVYGNGKSVARKRR